MYAHRYAHHFMTTSFSIRPTKTQSGKIYVLISEGRKRQFRFSTGHEVRQLEHWNKRTQLVRSVASENHDIINHQLKRLQAHIEAEFYRAKLCGRKRNKGFYEAMACSALSGAAMAEKTLEWCRSITNGALNTSCAENKPSPPMSPR